jgi:hypothetical protein
MIHRGSGLALLLAAAIGPALTPSAHAGGYRGMTAGWPSYANGYYAAAYPANYGVGPAYYVARPVAPGYGSQTVAGAYYSGQPLAGAQYVPVTAAYGNPYYFGAYGAAPAAQRAAIAAYYPSAATAYYGAGGTALYAPTPAYYAPTQYGSTTAGYAPANSYAVSPAGSSYAGSEAGHYYGQPTQLNYVPPRFDYRTTYAAVPVYMYRPVTVYDPVTAQPVTCLQPATTTTCQAQRHRWFSWLHPHNWFGGHGGCGAAPAPTTAYCGPSGCAQPYYPVPGATIIPTVPVQPTAPIITQPIPSGTIIPPAGTTIPPPPTRTPSGLSPADLQPRLPSGGTFTPAPSGTFTPVPGSTIIAPPPGTAPGGSFPTSPAPAFGPRSTFPSGSNYPPASDPYTSSSRISGGTAFGSGYRSNGLKPSTESRPQTPAAAPLLRAPELGPALPPSVQTVPDLDAQQMPRPINRAPQLLEPRDKTAARARQRWAVVSAVWPHQQTSAQPAAEPRVVATNAYGPHSTLRLEHSPYAASTVKSAEYDDSGWKSGR